MDSCPERKSIRLKAYDYSSTGYYFITICTHERAKLFGEIVGADSISARLILNKAGKMIDDLYHDTINRFPNVVSAKHIVMPNHFHGIIAIERADMESAPTLSEIIQSFKRNTTVKYIDAVKKGEFPPFNKRIWQRNYYDHIIRDEADYSAVWQYIDDNPAKWTEDEYFQ